MLVVAAEPLFVCLFVTWHLTSWQRSRVPKRRAGVDLWGGIWPRFDQDRPVEPYSVFLLRVQTHTCSLCTSLDNQVSFKMNWNVRYLHVMYKYALCPYSAFFLLLSSLNAAAAAKLCIECISKDCPQSGCMILWLIFPDIQTFDSHSVLVYSALSPRLKGFYGTVEHSRV